jgi:hypothetical protein
MGSITSATLKVNVNGLPTKEKGRLCFGDAKAVAAFKFGKGWGQIRTLAPYAG